MRSGNLLLPLLVIIVSGVVSASAATAPGDANNHLSRPVRCRQVTAQLRERLESVTEACIDGRTVDLARAASQADAWWASRPSPWPNYAGSDSLLHDMASAAGRRDSNRAAVAAVKLSVNSLGWCGGPSSTADDLMVLDLAGAAGWLRAHEQSLGWPAGLDEVTGRVDEALVRKGRADLGSRLKTAIAGLVAIPDRSHGSSQAATAVLDLVDELEKALR